jgi:phospholipase/carboxylesterase
MSRQSNQSKNNSNTRRLGNIKCLDQMVDNSDQWVILFHGYGADAYDLKPLGDILHPREPSNWLFPQGLLEVPIGPGWTGRAWWNVDLEALQKRQAKGTAADLSDEKPDGMIKARTLAMEMISELKVDWSNIILGGFSQGAMLATDLFLHAPKSPRGLVLFSGALVNKKEWKPLIPQRAGARFFISHGTQDPVLPHRSAQQLETLLNAGGMKGGLMSFTGGHEIPPQVIDKANEYLKGI